MSNAVRVRMFLGTALLALCAQASAQILVGQSIALSGGLADFGNAVVRGAKLHFDEVNAAGGIAGQKIRLISVDDAGKADSTAENVKQLISREKVIAIFGGIEGGPCTRSLKVASELKTPFIACLAGSPEMREPFDAYAFPVRAPHFAEFSKIIEMAASYGYTSFGFLHSDSDTGRKHLANVNRLLAAKKLAPAKPFSIVKGVKPEDVAREVRESGVHVLFNHGSYDFFADVIIQVRAASPTQPAFFAVNSGIAAMAKKLGDKGRGVTFTSVVPFPNSGREEIVREFRSLFQAAFGKGTSPSLGEMEGYISARVLTEGLKRSGKSPTRESLLAAMGNLGTVNLGGYILNFSPTERQGSRYVNTGVILGDGRFVH